MLILAGVSINAIVGENGVLSRAQYSSFMSEMAAVEEAVQLWKAGDLIESKGKVNTAIPANGLWESEKINPNTITQENKRLVGEMGYYRLWSKNGMPENNILSLDDNLYNSFSGDFIGYPAGVQDVYYLNNEALNLDKNKVYLIDAATSVVYSTTGIILNGVRCYSTHMAKAVMGNNVAPLFAEAEMSGGGNNIIYAGETYLKDKNGNYIDENGNIVSEENKVLNPNGFQIIASPNSDNIFKLYNSGELYGKGIKGIQLNTSKEEMEKINSYIWQEFEIPTEIPGASTNDIKVMPGYNVVYVIDSEGYLWAWGNNANNRLGLTQEQQVEYTGREAVRLNVAGEKVKKVYGSFGMMTFVITESNKVYAAGINEYGGLGLGFKSSEVNEFTQVEVKNIDNIKKILPTKYATFIWYNDNTIYAAGTNHSGRLFATGSKNEYLEKFTEIYNGVIGPDIDVDSPIKDILFANHSVMILKENGTLWQTGYRYYDGSGGGADLPDASKYSSCIPIFLQFPEETFGSNVTGIYQLGPSRLITRINSSGELEVWGTPGSANNLGLGEETYNSANYWKIPIPEELSNDGIKEIFTTRNNVYYLSNSGKVYVSGDATTSGLNLNSGKVNGVVYSGLDNIETLYSTDIVLYNTISATGSTPICFTGKDGKIYTTGSKDVVIRNEILQTTWKEIATNVKYFDASGAGYVDRNNNLWIAGSDSRKLGLGADSEVLKTIDNYILHTDSNIQGRVAEVKFLEGITMVKTTNNELWVTGYYENDGIKYHPGWAEAENKTTFVKILDNVLHYSGSGTTNGSRIAVTTDGVYIWGENYSGAVGSTKTSIIIPELLELPTEIGGIANIKQCVMHYGSRTNIVTKTGNLFLTGTWTNDAYDGGHTSTKYFSKYTYNLNLLDDEKIIQMSAINGESAVILTDLGRVFGYGPAYRLGIGSTSTANVETQLLSGIDNVSQIVAGNGWYIAVKKDGTVWGTGKNTYGVLGRWLGTDRNSPNSRYKTAYEWVECPELEI